MTNCRLPGRRPKALIASLMFVLYSTAANGQATASAPPEISGQELAAAVQDLRAEVQELRATVAEMKSDAATYRAETEELRKQLAEMQASAASQKPVESAPASETSDGNSVSQKISSLEETTQLLESEIRSQYQTKVESASKYRVRLSGLALLNLFNNRGYVDNLDVPTYAASSNTYGTTQAFGATLRQSEIGLEVFGPEVFGAKTSGQLQVDFGGGFPVGALDGVNSGLVRLRTGYMRLDWSHTSIVAGQDSLFISPESPTSFASLIVPEFGYSGNLWAWTPQLRIEHKFDLTDNQNLRVQAGILDNLTGEPLNTARRQVQAGESSGLPAYALRTDRKSVV